MTRRVSASPRLKVALGVKPTVRHEAHVPGATRYYGQARGVWVATGAQVKAHADDGRDAVCDEYVRDDGAVALRCPKTNKIVYFDAIPGGAE